MTDRGDAQLAQILGREPAQYILVDVVGAEPGCVLLEPEPTQPLGYIHRDCLTTANRGPLQPPCGILSSWSRKVTGLGHRRGGPSPGRSWKEAPSPRPSHRLRRPRSFP